MVNVMSRRSKDTKKILRSGLGSIRRNEYKKAIKKISEAIKFDEEIAKIPLVWLNLGIAYVNVKKYEQALDSFSNVIELDKKNTDAWLKKGLSSKRERMESLKL